MKRLIIICFVPLLLYGCGPRFIYSNLEWLIPQYVDDYISLNREQKRMLDKRLLQQLEWHCRTQLPVYVKSLRELSNDLSGANHPIDYERMQYYKNRFLKHWQDLMRHIGPDIADILKTASDPQLIELFENIEKQTQEYRSDYVDLPPSELVQKRQERMAEFLEEWISRLNPEQERAVLDWSEQLKPFAADRLQYREIVLAEFREMLEQRRHFDDFRNEFTELLTHQTIFNLKPS